MLIWEIISDSMPTDPTAIAIKAKERKLKNDKRAVKVQKAQLRLRNAQQAVTQAKQIKPA